MTKNSEYELLAKGYFGESYQDRTPQELLADLCKRIPLDSHALESILEGAKRVGDDEARQMIVEFLRPLDDHFEAMLTAFTEDLRRRQADGYSS
ncbi:hypothetical protein HYX12_03475 [Candidatus Woesearchaeota archaeon]|nr:hypothetical protein [Candidatus Woesearchaeota archaeon]